jgi:hypothetical protein
MFSNDWDVLAEVSTAEWAFAYLQRDAPVWQLTLVIVTAYDTSWMPYLLFATAFHFSLVARNKADASDSSISDRNIQMNVPIHASARWGGQTVDVVYT